MTSALRATSAHRATGVMVVGAQGRMGLEVRAALAAEPRLRFAGALERPGHPEVGQSLAPGVVLRDDPKRRSRAAASRSTSRFRRRPSRTCAPRPTQASPT